MTEAAKRLGVTRVTLGRLVREGALPVMTNPLDKRQRLIPEAAIRALEGERRGWRPSIAGAMYAPELQSDKIDEYLEAHWRPE